MYHLNVLQREIQHRGVFCTKYACGSPCIIDPVLGRCKHRQGCAHCGRPNDNSDADHGLWQCPHLTPFIIAMRAHTTHHTPNLFPPEGSASAVAATHEPTASADIASKIEPPSSGDAPLSAPPTPSPLESLQPTPTSPQHASAEHPSAEPASADYGGPDLQFEDIEIRD